MSKRKIQKDKQRSTQRKLKLYPHPGSLEGYVVPVPLVATIVLL
jgi:hypothetical protein